jgi:alpha-tubulin suppressor-like RCC1 family protein
MLCWGLNTQYQLGVAPPGHDGPESCSNQACSTRALLVLGLETLPVAAGAFGEAHTCGLFVDRTVICWGLNESGQLGFPLSTGQDQQSPINPVTNLAGAVALAAGSAHTCALLAGGAEVCWGSSANGDLGIGSEPGIVTTPAVVALHGVRSIAAGFASSCAIGDRAVACWGNDASGQVGDGLVGSDAMLPSVVQ